MFEKITQNQVILDCEYKLLQERIILMSEIIIKKDILLTTLTIISSLFIFPLAIRVLLGIYYILFINFSFENLVFLIGLMILFWIGLRNLISIIYLE